MMLTYCILVSYFALGYEQIVDTNVDTARFGLPVMSQGSRLDFSH